MNVLKNKTISASAVIAMIVLVMALPATAQEVMPPQQQEVRDDFTGEELENFVEVVKVQQEKEMQMIQAIEGEGLDLEKFNEILQAQQNPEAAATDVASEDMGKFEKASEQIIVLQQEMQTEVMGAINETGLGVETYQEIMMAYQTVPEVQKQVDDLLTR